MKFADLSSNRVARALVAGCVFATTLVGCSASPPWWQALKPAEPGACSTMTPPAGAAGKVTFDSSELVAGDASNSDVRDVMATVVALQQSWIGADAAAFVDRVTSDVTRLTSWSGGIQSGPQEVARALPNEWGFLELTPDGHTRSANMTIRRAEVSVKDHTAKALYWVDMVSGETTSIAHHVSDWAYNNRGLILQAFVNDNGCWKLSHESDSWWLAYDPVAKMPATSGTASFRYDFSYPVNDLARAVRFYSTFLGQPEVQTATYAAFDMGGPRLVLDNTGLDGFAPARPGLPNGYTTIYVDDLTKTIARLENTGTKFLTGIRYRGPDLYVVGSDPGGNVFVVMQRVYPVGDHPAPGMPAVQAADGTPAGVVAAVQGLASAWLRTDERAVMAAGVGNDSRWFDSSRLNNRGIDRGPNGIRDGLAANWSQYDRSRSGLAATMTIRSLRAKRFGAGAIVTYVRELSGQGEHPFKQVAFVTHIFEDGAEGGMKLSDTFITKLHQPTGEVQNLDYVETPEPDLQAARRFYGDTMGFGKPYSDESWYGFWSIESVFGIYAANPAEGAQPGRANSSASLVVYSVEDARARLESMGSTFPVIPSINSRGGTDDEGNYLTLLATDSEGNAVVFSEYSNY
jgi:predicted enzyme related to lactoylglutathione lyase